jgi:hypothetical protein
MNSYSVHHYNHSLEGKLHVTGQLPSAIVVLEGDGLVFQLPQSESLNYPVNRRVSFNEFSTYSDDHGVISVYTEQRPENIVVENTIQRTFVGRQQIRDFTGKRLLAQFITPYKGSDQSSWDLILLQDGNTEFQGFPELARFELLTEWHQAKFKDNLDLESGTTVTAGDKLEIMVNNMIPAPIFLETTAGNLSHYRVQDSQIITLDTTGLTPGEVVKVKAGRRYFPGIQEVLVSVQ